MTTIRTTCPKCGSVELGIEAIFLSLRQGGGEGSYRFLCPGCLDNVEKPADQKVVALLLSVGVDVDGFGNEDQEGFPAHHDTEYLEDRPSGPPLTVDDLISFHFLLQDDEQLARALAFG
jgi:hypothetical protein